MDHKRFIASLPPAARTRLCQRKDLPGLLRATVHFGLILGFGLYISAGAPWWGLVVPVQGILIVFTFTLLHETVHDTPFAQLWLNRLFGSLAAGLLALPPLWFRYFHLAHHRFTNDPARDPELAEPRPQSWGQYLRYLSGLPVWASNFRQLVSNAGKGQLAAYVPAAQHSRIRREARVMLAFYAGLMAALFLGQAWIFWAWILPALLGQPALRLYLLAEHGHCPAVADMFENTRTTYTARLIRLLAWNMPYHAEHHAMPNVPFHQLPNLNALCAAHLKSTSSGYRAFHRDYQSRLRYSKRPLT